MFFFRVENFSIQTLTTETDSDAVWVNVLSNKNHFKSCHSERETNTQTQVQQSDWSSWTTRCWVTNTQTVPPESSQSIWGIHLHIYIARLLKKALSKILITILSVVFIPYINFYIVIYNINIQHLP